MNWEILLMGWRNIVLEGHCLNTQENFDDVPCKNNEQGFVSFECLCGDKGYCRYFAFSKARSCVVMTDHDGDEIKFDSFDCEETDRDIWKREEIRWKKAWLKIFNDHS